MKKLKPIIFVQGDKKKYRQNMYAQNLILKAMSKGVTDPNELKKIAGLKTIADVYRTLDKMAIRKEFHAALTRSNISLDYIVESLKKIIDSSDSDKIKLTGLTTLLKALGLDKYEEVEGAAGTWQDAVTKAIEGDLKNSPKMIEDEQDEELVIEGEVVSLEPEEVEEMEEYKVTPPVVPDDIKELHEREMKLGKDLYAD